MLKKIPPCGALAKESRHEKTYVTASKCNNPCVA